MYKVLASWFGTGLILGKLRGSHAGSGTVGAVAAFPIAYLLGSIGPGAQILGTAVVVGLAFWSVRPLAEVEGDAGWIVIDEAAGTFLAVIGLAIIPALVALVVFRAADIFKGAFPGVARAEKIPGATGIISDDLVAGLYGLVAGIVVSAF